jgi:hypothetical protein
MSQCNICGKEITRGNLFCSEDCRLSYEKRQLIESRKPCSFFDVVGAIRNRTAVYVAPHSTLPVYLNAIELESGNGRTWNIRTSNGHALFWDEIKTPVKFWC